MKNFFILICLLSFGISSATDAPKPEKIYSITKVIKTRSYYLEQADLWKKEIDKKGKSVNAWLNYYTATRMANITTIDEQKPFDLISIVNQIEKAIPDAYEFHYIKSWQYGYGPDAFEHALRAFEIDPDRTEIYPHLIVHYEMGGQVDKMNEFCQKWLDSGNVSPGMLSWNYNVLMSLEPNALLLTSGDNDTYPIWLLQQVRSVRPDVNIINLPLVATYNNYRNRLFRKNSVDSFAHDPARFPDRSYLIHSITSHIIETSDRPVYLGMNIDRSIRDQNSDQLYLVGLAFKYSNQVFDNVGQLRDNVEQHFLTDYLNFNPYNDISQSIVDRMNLNYIPPFVILHKHYINNKENAKAENIKNITVKVADAAGQLDKVMAYMGDSTEKPKNKIASTIEAKELDKNMMKISKNLYADDTEVTNGEYERFMIDLVKNKAYDQIAICKPETTDWLELMNEKFKGIPKSSIHLKKGGQGDFATKVNDFDRATEEKIFPNGHPDGARAPLQNVSYEAAKHYCQWITEVYNQSDSKKKKFKKVLFRLPTEAEWESAARAGKVGLKYPWGGQYYQNAKGCYLSNFNVSYEPPCVDCKYTSSGNDGGLFTVPADAYFPNDLGLYGLCGNVAEMVEEQGIAKGGSWEDRPEDCTIDSKKSYTTQSPAIGFRVFMEVIEY